MKKKVLTILLVLVMVTSFVVMSGCFQNESCNHILTTFETDTSTCTSAGVASGYCTKCGQPVRIYIGAHHRYEEGVCTLCEDVDYTYWDGKSVPEIENLKAYTERYLPNIQADSYVDFARLYTIDLEKHPDLYDTGLFWCYYDEELGSVKEVSIRDTDKIDELIEKGYIDSNKPTTIFTHGMAVDEHKRVYDKNGDEIITGGRYSAYLDTLDPNNPQYAEYVEPATGTVNVNLIYLKNGYNVLNFSYRRYSDEITKTVTEVGADGVAYDQLYMNNMIDECKVFTTEGPAGMRYRYPDGTFSDGTAWNGKAGEVREDIDFTIAEFYAAEYVRMFNYMVEKGVFGEHTTIQTSGHSLGGVVTVMGNFLISELVRVNQIPSYYLTDRVILEDSYLGVYSGYGENLPDYSEIDTTTKWFLVYDREVHWTGKKLDGCGSFGAYISALYTLSQTFNVACEYYVDISITAFPTIPAMKVKHLVWSLCAVQMYNLKYKPDSSHDAIRELRVAAIIEGLHPTTVDGENAVYCTLTNDEIKERTGKIYVQVEGNNTADLSDDRFELRTIDEMRSKK